MEEKHYYEKGTEKAKMSYIIFENVLIILLIVVGFLGMYSLSISGLPIAPVSYMAFGVIMLGFVLRKSLCTCCYYYDKWCHCGWGKLSSALFSKDSGNQEVGGKLAGFTWGILMGVPVIGMIAVVVIGNISLTDELVFFVPFIVLVAINGILHKKNCEKCKMRFICPGSGARKK